MKTIYFSLFWVTIISGCSRRPKEQFKEQSRVTIKFIIDDSVQRLDNTYRVFLLNNRDTLYTKTKADTVYLPEVQDNKKYDVLFMFQARQLLFKGISGFNILPDQKMLWEIGIDNKPFNYLHGLLLNEEYVRGLYSKIEYLRFNPQERGDGIQIVNKY